MKNRIKELADASGLSVAKLGEMCGMKAHAFRRYARNEAQPKSELAVKIAAIFGITVDELFEKGDAPAPARKPAGLAEAPNRFTRPPAPKGSRIPIYAFAAGGMVGSDTSMAEPFDYIERPSFLPGSGDAYAVVVAGSSMEPRYLPGEIVYAIPRALVRSGDFVVVVTGDGHDRKAVVKQYVRRDDGHVTLHQFNPERDIQVPVEEIDTIDLITGSSAK